MQLSGLELERLTAFRRLLHSLPELLGEECETAVLIGDALAETRPTLVLAGLGGHGVAAVYDGAGPGPTVMIRSELDALPIFEMSDVPHRSTVPGKAHLCGHDGHSTILLGLACQLKRNPPERGRVVLLFQPAEETGAGARAVLADPRFEQIRPEWSFSLHNMPGVPIGQALLTFGHVNCASQGLRVRLIGKTSHASVPEAGISPGPALASLIQGLQLLGPGGELSPDFRLVTVTHARLGEPAFGIAPGDAELFVTLRAMTDEGMADLLTQANALIQKQVALHNLRLDTSHHDVFAACANDPAATAHLESALAAEGIAVSQAGLPMRGSEDFGVFGSVSKSAMFFLGAGERHPMLHNPDYDFPDELIPISVRIFERVIRNLLG